ncbi:alpha/beta hydrolase [Mesorhizobium sp. LHD-90]|uniref:alpha/beta fold hydrolase n=1 Tax=Mesorhizobium sp. LHD-90 TaxID=3071414 RepID=UPI0027DF4733|nr:alpha/beta hydrolase [Mesorhizobium sp. LHD-90]MDQ6435276.1 alpha/beta hydrolase [Mesorhizobium sp. LHD-90]
MTVATLGRDDAALKIFDTGQGPAVVFQHGLGGDEAQVAQTFPASLPCRRLTLECRGHGGSNLGSKRPFSFALFANDIVAAADRAGIGRFVAGGISMGAALALRLAARHPDRIGGLILVRPAWTFCSAPENLAPIGEVARLIKNHPLAEARTTFEWSNTAARLKAEAPDNLNSLLGYFDRPDIFRFAEVLADISSDGPGTSEAEAAALAIPTLVIGNEMDAIHPLPMARTLAAAIPGAAFRKITPKAGDKDRHFAEVQAAIAAFLNSHFDIPNGASS